MRFLSILILIIFLSFNCKRNLLIDLSSYQEYSLNQKHTDVILLKTFEAPASCRDDDTTMYANAFLCKVGETNDTVIVVDLCSELPYFLKESYKKDRHLIIDTSKVKRPSIKTVHVNEKVVPFLKAGNKYLLSELYKLEY